MNKDTNNTARVIDFDGSIPDSFLSGASDGRLIVTVKLSDVDTTSDKEKRLMEEAGMSMDSCSGRLVIECSLEVGELKTEEIINASPEEFIKNGMIAGILDALYGGLVDRRGINIAEAIDCAKEKADSAVEACRRIKAIEDLGNLVRLVTSGDDGGHA